MLVQPDCLQGRRGPRALLCQPPPPPMLCWLYRLAAAATPGTLGSPPPRSPFPAKTKPCPAGSAPLPPAPARAARWASAPRPGGSSSRVLSCCWRCRRRGAASRGLAGTIDPPPAVRRVRRGALAPVLVPGGGSGAPEPAAPVRLPTAGPPHGRTGVGEPGEGGLHTRGLPPYCKLSTSNIAPQGVRGGTVVRARWRNDHNTAGWLLRACVCVCDIPSC